MRLLLVASQFPPVRGYAVGRAIQGLARNLAGLGHDVHVLTSRHSDADIPRDGYVVHNLLDEYPFQAYSDALQNVLTDLPACARLAEIWSQHGPFDAVAAHDWAGSLVASLAKAVYDVPLVATLSGTQVGRVANKLSREDLFVADMEKWLCERADVVCVPSDAVRSEVMKHYKVPEGKVVVVPDATGEETFAARVDLEEFRAMFAAPDEPLLVFAGRLTTAKGADRFLEIFDLVRRKAPKARAAVAGEGPLGDEMRAQAEAHRLADVVRFTGYLGPIVTGALLRAADALVVPSRYEAGCASVIEAVLHDLPVVAAEVGAMAELPRTWPQVTLVKTEDIRVFAQAVSGTLRVRRATRDPAPRDERLATNFRWAGAARAMEQAFQAVLAGVR